MVPLEYLKSLEEIDQVIEYAWDEHVLSVAMTDVKKCQEKIKSQDVTKFWVGGCFPMLAVIYMDHLIFPQAAINEHQLNYSLPRACFVHQTDFDLVCEYDKNKLSLGKASFGKCRFRPLSETPYAALPQEGGVTGIAVGNSNAATQDVEDVNLNGNQDEAAAKDTPIDDVNPMENVNSTEEDVCGSLDDWLQNPAPFGVELELPAHLAEIYDKHTKLYAAELKGATNSFVQVLQAMHCRRMGQLLKDVHLVSSSNQQATNVTFDIPPHRSNGAPQVDERGGRKQSASSKAADECCGSKQNDGTNAADERAGTKGSAGTKAADEQSTDKVVVEPAEGARSIRSSSSTDETNGGNVPELRVETSADGNQANAEKQQVSSGEDVEHGDQPGASVGGHWSDAPSTSLFKEGTKEYNWWIGVPRAVVDSNTSSPDNNATTPKSCAVFDATPQAQVSSGIKVPVYDVTPIAMAPFSSGTAGSPKPQEDPVVLVSSREPSPNRDEDNARLKGEKKIKNKKRAASPNSAGPKYKKIKTDSKIEAMYQYFIMKRYKMKKMKKGEIEPPFIRIGDFHTTYSNFQKSLKPRAQMCNEVMSLFIESFNIEQLSSSHKQKKFAFSFLMSVSSSFFASFYSHCFCCGPCLPCCNSSPLIVIFFSCQTLVTTTTFCPPRSFRSKCLQKRAEEGVPKLSDFSFRPTFLHHRSGWPLDSLCCQPFAQAV